MSIAVLRDRMRISRIGLSTNSWCARKLSIKRRLKTQHQPLY